MDIEKNTTYACRVVSMNGQEVDYLSELVNEISKEFTDITKRKRVIPREFGRKMPGV